MPKRRIDGQIKDTVERYDMLYDMLYAMFSTRSGNEQVTVD